jgi:hypothetical protein
MALTIPNTIANGITADGSNMAANFNAVGNYSLAVDLRADVLEADSLEAATTRFSITTDFTVIKGTSQTVSFETVTNDTDDWFSGAHPTYLTCPATGVYLVTLHLNYSGGSSGYVRSYFLDDDAVPAIAGTPQRAIEVDSNYDLYDTVFLKAAKGEPLFLTKGKKFKVTCTEVSGSTNRTIQDLDLFITKLYTV